MDSAERVDKEGKVLTMSVVIEPDRRTAQPVFVKGLGEWPGSDCVESDLTCISTWTLPSKIGMIA